MEDLIYRMMRRFLMRLCSVLCFTSFLMANCAGLSAQAFRFTEEHGEYQVGLSIVEQYDRTRSFRNEAILGPPDSKAGYRPIQTLVWFPAQSVSGGAMTVRDYEALVTTETDFSNRIAPGALATWTSDQGPRASDLLWAYRKAVPKDGLYPVVIYAPGYSSQSWENADLCEYLASYGYVVIASPDMGDTARGMTDDLNGISAQARDITFLIDYAKTLPNTDMKRITVIGYSWGGISNLFAAARDHRITALVALDGEMRYSPGLVADAEDVQPASIAVPMLFFTQGEITLEDEARWFSDKTKANGPSVLNSWKGDLTVVHMMGFVHFEFSSMSQRSEARWSSYAKDHKADYTRDEGQTGYGWVCRYTRNFLDAYLKDNAVAQAFLARYPADNGVPKHFIYVDRRQHAQ